MACQAQDVTTCIISGVAKLLVTGGDRRTAETRSRILEATIALSFEKGPLATTMGEIALRAGVERVTLYRHFGDERALHRAAALLCKERYPPPAAAPLRDIRDPKARAERALTALYAHWERMAPLVRPILRDADVAPQRFSLELRDRYVQDIRDAVLAAFPATARRRAELRDAVRHAFEFRTWDSLSRGGFTRGRAVALMTRLVMTAARAR
jgi:AcrR family transcriptional regulator